ncbi:hypothetical protein L596_020912 [Steinernema carpocapsae]|uniref:Serpentine receptor class gamma n=1 Tax=Steinernema carpocapsae TaxID=34508 RepID=A0A4U5MUX9_STECR|nr:hypothetical protein L596_020912 [Steinernema carpocapsae]
MATNLSPVVGFSYIGIAIFFTPFYIRLIYIFIFNKKYRSLQCYVIMIHMGIAQMLLSLNYFVCGLFHAFDSNLFGMADVLVITVVQVVKIEAVLGFILALSRFTIIFEMKFPKQIANFLLGFAWLFFICAVALFFTPWAGYTIVKGSYMPTLNLKLPYSILLHTIGGYVYEFIILCTLCLYVLIVIRILYVKAKNKVLKDFKKEAKVLVYAGIRFLCDSVLSVSYHYIALPEVPETNFVLGMLYGLNNLALPPLLYLMLYSATKKENKCGCRQKCFTCQVVSGQE